MKGCRKQRIERVGPDTQSLLVIGWKAWVFIPGLGQRPHGEPDSLELLGAVEVFHAEWQGQVPDSISGVMNRINS